MRDSSPDQEVAIWCRIAAASIAYHEQYLGDEPEPGSRGKLIAALVSISTGVEDVEALGVPVDVGRELLAFYDGLSEG